MKFGSDSTWFQKGSVWYFGLLHNIGLPIFIIKVIRSYLFDRSFIVDFKARSAPYSVEAFLRSQFLDQLYLMFLLMIYLKSAIHTSQSMRMTRSFIPFHGVWLCSHIDCKIMLQFLLIERCQSTLIKRRQLSSRRKLRSPPPMRILDYSVS